MEHNTIVARPCVSLASKPATEVTSTKKFYIFILLVIIWNAFSEIRWHVTNLTKKYSCCNIKNNNNNYQRKYLKGSTFCRKFAFIRCDQFSTWQILSCLHISHDIFLVCQFYNHTNNLPDIVWYYLQIKPMDNISFPQANCSTNQFTIFY